MPIAIVMRSAEVKLVEMLGSIRDPYGWQAIHFNLNQLLEQYQSEYQVKIAINLINDLLRLYEGGIFLLHDHGIIVMCNQLEKTVLNKLVFQLRYLYMDDPLAYSDEGHENPDFCTIYDLARDWNSFSDLCNKRMAALARKQNNPARAPETLRSPVIEVKPRHEQSMVSSVALQPMPSSAPVFETVERELQVTDLASVIRRQPVCTVGQSLTARRVFDELYMHIAHLRQILTSDTQFISNRWLFKYLTTTLDQRVLELIKSNTAQYLASPISLNLNVETVLSQSFEAFDAALSTLSKASVVIELPVVDVFADMSAFTLARRLAQKMGYRICLDGLTINSFINIDRKRLELDLLKVQWNADIEADLKSSQNIELAKAVMDCGSNRVILCRCDSKLAVDFGHALGISLFQGRFIDSLVNPSQVVSN